MSIGKTFCELWPKPANEPIGKREFRKGHLPEEYESCPRALSQSRTSCFVWHWTVSGVANSRQQASLRRVFMATVHPL